MGETLIYDYISFLDIKPGNIYLARTREGFKRLCEVMCSDTHDCQLGWVKKVDEIHRNDKHAVAATVHFLDPQFGTRDVYCQLVGNEYKFKGWFGDFEPTLYRLTPDWIDAEIHHLHRQQAAIQKQQVAIQKQVDMLTQLREISKDQYVYDIPTATY